MPLPPAQPPSPRFTFVAFHPTPGRLVFELTSDPAGLPPLPDGTVLAAVLEPAIDGYAPLLVRLPLPAPPAE